MSESRSILVALCKKCMELASMCTELVSDITSNTKDISEYNAPELQTLNDRTNEAIKIASQLLRLLINLKINVARAANKPAKDEIVKALKIMQGEFKELGETALLKAIIAGQKFKEYLKKL